MSKLKEYDVSFEAIAILRVKADCSERAICKAFQDISKGDFEIRDYDVTLAEEPETE